MYYKPEQTKGGRQLYHASNEVMRTDLFEDIQPQDVQGIAEVMMFKEYKLKYPNYANVPSNVFVMRQKYNTKAEIAVPELQKSCHCVCFINPDDAVMLCPECDESIHTYCFEKDSTKTCPKCGKALVEAKELLEDYKKRKRISNPLLEEGFVQIISRQKKQS